MRPAAATTGGGFVALVVGGATFWSPDFRADCVLPGAGTTGPFLGSADGLVGIVGCALISCGGLTRQVPEASLDVVLFWREATPCIA